MGSVRLVTRRRLAGLLIVVAFSLLVLALLNPLRRSNDAIAGDLLGQAPPGTPREAVQALVAERGWRQGGIVGEGREGDLSVVPGTYQGIPFQVRVFALWEFDDRGRLRTIRVSRAADAL